MEGKPLELRDITGKPGQLEQVYRLRVVAWKTQVVMPADLQIWKEPIDDTARHWGFLQGDEVVAAFRLSFHSTLTDVPHPEVLEGVWEPPAGGPIAYFARMVVHPDHRRRGLFGRATQVCLDAAGEAGAVVVVGAVGSIGANQFSGEVLRKAGFLPAGVGNPYRTVPYQATDAPRIFVHGLCGRAMEPQAPRAAL